jgi:hypothetical protein
MSILAAIEKSKKSSPSPSKSGNSFHTPTGSPYQAIEKQSAKKKQSSLKGFVHTVVKLILSLRGDMEQILLLLQNLVELYTTSISIYTTAITNVNNNKITININGKNGENVTHTFYQSKTNVFDTFSDIGPKLLAKLLVDIDSVILQIQQFMRNIGDYLAALKLCSHDAINCVVDEHPQMFSELGTIFTTEHALNIQQIAIQYEQENDRMKNMLKLIKMDENKDSKNIRPDNIEHWKTCLNNATQTYENWGEQSKLSCVDSEFIDLFIITNGGGEISDPM